ncbi:hypothetical protein V6N11_075352 [Hibiscus sabdariffa]|uniref:Uncharacterized protein n=1 Tax=Hibiscus sabdariffa TaxID=183260 RepID=A0ABR2R685_9ROSI
MLKTYKNQSNKQIPTYFKYASKRVIGEICTPLPTTFLSMKISRIFHHARRIYKLFKPSKIHFRLQNMEQRKMTSSRSNSVIRDEDGYKNVPIHSQVMKIKLEFEKIMHPSLRHPDIRRVLQEITAILIPSGVS